MARITMEINPHEYADPELIQAWIADGLALEQQPDAEATETIAPTTAATVEEYRAALAGAPPPGVAAPAGPVPGAAPAGRRGRKTNAEKAAEREAAEKALAAAGAGQGAALPPGVAPPAAAAADPLPGVAPASAPPGVAAPPGMTNGAAPPPGVPTAPPMGFAPPGAAPPGVMPQQVLPAAPTLAPPPAPMPAAMPQSQPLPPAADGIMRIEDFRAANMQVQEHRPGKMNMIMRALTWPSDKSPKEAWFTLDAVPPEFRSRCFDELEYVQ